MANKEELLQYLATNYFKVGHPLYYAGPGKINSIFEGSLKIEDIQDFVERHHPYTIFKETKKGALNPIYKRFKRQQFQIDLLEIRNISKNNKGFNFLLTVIDAYTKFAWVIPLQNKQSKTVLEAFKNIINKLDEKPLNIISDLGTNLCFFLSAGKLPSNPSEGHCFFSPAPKNEPTTFFARGAKKGYGSFSALGRKKAMTF